MAKQVRWALPYTLRFSLSAERGYRRHKEIFEAFRNREAEKVRQLIETHNNETLNRVLAQMDVKFPGVQIGESLMQYRASGSARDKIGWSSGYRH